MEIDLLKNPQAKLANDLIEFTDQSIFLTGRAGTGKTTFLKYIQQKIRKECIVLAPTGVAAINAGGTTIHSFFQLPFAPFIFQEASIEKDQNVANLLGKIHLRRERREVIKKLELIIIDEISMVRCDIMDEIDLILRDIRNCPTKPFGGVQMVMIGDLHQLPPVAGPDNWEVLSTQYQSPYFFSSKVIESYPPLCIELEKIYRQQDDQFIELLSKIRNDQMDEEGYHLLNSRFNPNFQAERQGEYITLTTHNRKASIINQQQLNRITEDTKEYLAEVKGDFSEKNYPAEASLILKKGAQVMFLKNDIGNNRRYYNGKIGIIEKLEDKTLWVRCKGEENAIEVSQDTWRNIRYTFNKTKQKIEEEELGTFKQIPLRLAWAITVHKSQGLTFEHAIIDVKNAFESGQVYVALSRCTSLDGMILSSPVLRDSFSCDARIELFIEKNRLRQRPAWLEEKMTASKSGVMKEKLDLVNTWQLSRELCELIAEENGTSLDATQMKIAIEWERAIASVLSKARQFLSIHPSIEKYKDYAAIMVMQLKPICGTIEPLHLKGKTGKQTTAFRKKARSLQKELNDRLQAWEELVG